MGQLDEGMFNRDHKMEQYLFYLLEFLERGVILF